MKYAIILAAVMSTNAFAVGPASSKMMMCSGEHLSKMTTMVGAMTDGPGIGDVRTYSDGKHRYGQRRHARMQHDDEEYASASQESYEPHEAREDDVIQFWLVFDA